MSNQLAAPQIDAKRRYVCRHIHTAGHRCGSPALLDQQFCYYHQSIRRPAPAAGKFRFLDAAEPFVLPVVEDRASALLVASQILSRIASNDLDPTRATRLIYGLQVAGTFLPREPRESRSTASTRDSSPVPANLPALIEQPVLDETLGPLAPIAEFVPPESQAPRNAVSDAFYMFRRQHECPSCHAQLTIAIPHGARFPVLDLADPQPATNPEPATINPEIAANSTEPATNSTEPTENDAESAPNSTDPAANSTESAILPTLQAVAVPIKPVTAPIEAVTAPCEVVITAEIVILAKPESPYCPPAPILLQAVATPIEAVATPCEVVITAEIVILAKPESPYCPQPRIPPGHRYTH